MIRDGCDGWTGVRMEDGGERDGVRTGVDGGEDERDGVWTGVDGREGVRMEDGGDGRWRGARRGVDGRGRG